MILALSQAQIFEQDSANLLSGIKNTMVSRSRERHKEVGRKENIRGMKLGIGLKRECLGNVFEKGVLKNKVL